MAEPLPDADAASAPEIASTATAAAAEVVAAPPPAAPVVPARARSAARTEPSAFIKYLVARAGSPRVLSSAAAPAGDTRRASGETQFTNPLHARK